MTSITFFLSFIPLLAFILLIVNLMFAPHNPYQEKNSTFECGFHSFLAQNRTQFHISFFIFALLFLLFDLEILLIYPYAVSSYNNGLYGLILMLIFFLALTLGFSFELGKNALKIDSRQMFALISKSSSITTHKSMLSLAYIITEVPLFDLVDVIPVDVTPANVIPDDVTPEDGLGILILILACFAAIGLIVWICHMLPNITWYLKYDHRIRRHRRLNEDEMKERLIYLETRQMEYNREHGRRTTYAEYDPVNIELTEIDRHWLHFYLLRSFSDRYRLIDHPTHGKVLVRGVYVQGVSSPRAIYPSAPLIEDIRRA